MKHKHYDMIVAKAANMELVVFYKLPCEEWWQSDSECEALPDEVEIEYFPCLPQHKKACLHWLNGGDIQVLDSNWINVNPVESYPWEDEHDFMCEDSKIRIKPKKEKRLLAINGDQVSFANSLLCYPQETQFIEIEIEVEA